MIILRPLKLWSTLLQRYLQPKLSSMKICSQRRKNSDTLPKF
eukprot:UN07341